MGGLEEKSKVWDTKIILGVTQAILSRVQSSSFSDVFLNLCFCSRFFNLPVLCHFLMLYTTILVSSLPYMCKLGFGNFSLSHLTRP